MKFNELDDCVAKISSSVLGNMETKTMVQEMLFKLVYNSCIEFNKNENFKKELTNVIRYLS